MMNSTSLDTLATIHKVIVQDQLSNNLLNDLSNDLLNDLSNDELSSVLSTDDDIHLERNTPFNKIKDQLLQEFKNQTLDKPLLMKLIIRCMEIVETTDFKGSEQTDLVINILIKILETDGLISPHKEELILFLTKDAGLVISIIVDASKGKININKLKPFMNIIINCLFSCLKKKQ